MDLIMTDEELMKDLGKCSYFEWKMRTEIMKNREWYRQRMRDEEFWKLLVEFRENEK